MTEHSKRIITKVEIPE